MNKIIAFCLCGLLFTSCGAYVTLPLNSENKASYSGIVEINGKSQQKLYDDTKEYVLLTFTNNGAPTLLDEKNERIYVKGTFKVRHKKYLFPIFFKTTIYDLVYTLKIYFKDGKYKYEVSDIFVSRKLNARINTTYWGNGLSIGSIKDSEILKHDIEWFLERKRYTCEWAKIIPMTNEGIKTQLANYEKYLRQENNIKSW